MTDVAAGGYVLRTYPTNYLYKYEVFYDGDRILSGWAFTEAGAYRKSLRGASKHAKNSPEVLTGATEP